jgi:ABC-type nitrate/sulfonate/bicarbonate transport system substrate-binding protein
MAAVFHAGFSSAQEKRAVRLVSTSFSWGSELAIRVAMARGYFKSEGIDLEPIYIRGGPAAMAAMAAGEVDFASGIGIQAPVRAKSRGLDLTIIGSVVTKTTYAIVGNKETRTLEDLRGKVVGVTGAGALSDFAVRTFLKRNRIDPDKDLVLRPIGGSSVRITALERGLIAAAPLGPEETVIMLGRGFPLIVNLGEVLAIPQGVLVTRAEVLAKYPETSKRFLKALILGVQHARRNKSDAIKAGFEAGLKGEPEAVAGAYDLFIPAYSFDLSIPIQGIQEVVNEDVRSGLVDSKFKVESVINDRPLKQAQEELRREGRLRP